MYKEHAEVRTPTSTGRRGFVTIDRTWLEQSDLTDGAMRLMLWLESHSDEYLGRMYISRSAERLGWGRNRVKRMIAELESLGLISTEQMPREFGGTVTKFTLHLDAWTAGPQQTIAMVHGEARAVVHGGAPSYEHQQVVETKSEDSSSSALLACLDLQIVEAEVVDEFDRFWSAYGNLAGTSKRLTLGFWKTALARGNDAEEIIAGLQAWVAYWRTPGANKAMYAQGFLNQDKWTVPPPPVQIEGSQHRSAPGADRLRLRMQAARMNQ